MSAVSLAPAELADICGHHNFADAQFEQEYRMALGEDLSGKSVLEICCGAGDLAGWLPQRAGARVVAVGGSAPSVAAAAAKWRHVPNLSFHCGDAAKLPEFADASFDLIVGQAALHHLAGNLRGTADELARLLKPGGRLIFIFEPLGHNPLVAAIRAAHNSWTQWIDEANLYEWILRDFSGRFARYEVYYFGLFAYFCKALPKRAGWARRIYGALNAMDQALFARWPKTRSYAANINICYWK